MNLFNFVVFGRLLNKRHFFRCACPNGQEIGPDGLTCMIPDAYLLFLKSGGINRASISTNQGYNLVLDFQNTSALDVSGDYIYWSDDSELTINKAFLNGSSRQVLVEFGLEKPSSLAVDFISQNIYWIDTILERIEVIKNNGSFRRVLLWKDLGTPVSLALDPKHGSMYWSSWTKKVIETANLDGTNRRIFVPNAGKRLILIEKWRLKYLFGFLYVNKFCYDFWELYFMAENTSPKIKQK